MKKQDQGLYEYAMRFPQMEFAQAWTWMHMLEFPLLQASGPGPGSKKKVDFVIQYNTQIVGIEFKFPNERNYQNFSQSADHVKLINDFQNEPTVQAFDNIYGFLVTISQKDTYNKIPSSKFVQNGKVMDEIWLSQQGKRWKLFNVGDSFETECTVGDLTYVGRFDKVL